MCSTPSFGILSFNFLGAQAFPSTLRLSGLSTPFLFPSGTTIPPSMPVSEKLTFLVRLKGALEVLLHHRVRQEAKGLVRRLSALPDPGMRMAVLGERLKALPSAVGAELLEVICQEAEEGDPFSQQACLHLLNSEALEQALGLKKLWEIQRALVDEGWGKALRLLFQEETRAVVPEGRRPEKGLGFRISQARKPSRRLIEQFLFDPDPRVVKVLLGNPRLTETEVLKMASSPRASSAVLEAVALDPRWRNRYLVKLALVYNPLTPTRIALGILPTLLSQDLQELADEGRVSRTVRVETRKLLHLRGAGRSNLEG